MQEHDNQKINSKFYKKQPILFIRVEILSST